MFYAAVDVSTGGFVESWKQRVIALDAVRRHLYCSSGLPPSGVPDNLAALQWKKMKVTRMHCAPEWVLLNPLHHTESEAKLYEVEIVGDKRTHRKEEVPPPEPLLCPSTGLQPIPGRFSLDNEEFIQDPFFLNELYEGLLDAFINMRLSSAATPSPPDSCGLHTVSTPTKRSFKHKCRSFLQALSDLCNPEWFIRFANAYDYQRFTFVVQWVLGFDKLMPPPHGGYPPYDPRNGVALAPVPLYLWRWFHAWERQAVYFCGAGDLLTRRRNSDRVNAGKGVRGGHLCILDGSVFFLYNRDGSAKPDPYCVLSLHQVRRVFYSGRRSHHPCVLFMTEGERDLLFLPAPQRLGKGVETMFPRAALGWSSECSAADGAAPGSTSTRLWATREVLQIVSVIQKVSLSSIETHPVIPIECLDVISVPDLAMEVQKRCGRPPSVRCYRGAAPKVSSLADIWLRYRIRVRELESQRATGAPWSIPAVPIYENNPSKIPLSEAQLRELQARVGQRRQRRHGSSVDGVPRGIAAFRLTEEGPLPLRSDAGEGERFCLQHIVSMSLNDVSRDSVPSFVEPSARYWQGSVGSTEEMQVGRGSTRSWSTLDAHVGPLSLLGLALYAPLDGPTSESSV
eukprot:gene1669-1034_t